MSTDDLAVRRARHQWRSEWALPPGNPIMPVCLCGQRNCDAAALGAALAEHEQRAAVAIRNLQYERNRLQDEFEQERAARQAAEAERDNWQESARQFCVNADYWRERAEAAEARVVEHAAAEGEWAATIRAEGMRAERYRAALALIRTRVADLPADAVDDAAWVMDDIARAALAAEEATDAG